jgi:hypothetical protein
MELIAGALVTLAALAYVLEPLARSPRVASGAQRAAPLPGAAELLVEQMRRRLTTSCPACGTSANPGSAFCAKCGNVLAS